MLRNRRLLAACALLSLLLGSCASAAREASLPNLSRTLTPLLCAELAAPEQDTEDVGFWGKDVETRRAKMHMKIDGQERARVTIRDLPGSEVAVEIDVDPPQTFARAPRLEMKFNGCTETEIGSRSWTIWRVNADGSVDSLATDFDSGRKRATTHIDHNSKYMIAD